MIPDGFNIGPLRIHFYGVLIMLGVLAAAWMSEREAKKFKQNSDVVWDVLVWVLIGGVLGARLWHILTPPPSMVERGITAAWYLTHPLDALAIWNGGLGIPGAVMGGALAMFIYSRGHKLSFAAWADIIAPGLALAQAIGRWGNFVNQEIYGAPTTLPWAVTIDAAHRLPQYQDVATYHPLFLYESLYNLLNMAFLLWLHRRYEKWLKSGDVFLVYLVSYPVFRFFLEFIRLDASQVAGLDANQTVMAVIALAAAAALIWRHRKGQPADAPDLPSSPDVTSASDAAPSETPGQVNEAEPTSS